MRTKELLTALLLPASSLAQGIELENPPFRESVSEFSKVSGDVIIGVMLTGDQSSAGDPSIVTGVAEQWTRSAEPVPVCVRLVSKDGRYEAENTYLVGPGYVGDHALFPYMGENASLLADRAAVALVKQGRCGNRNDTAIPVMWKAEPGTSATDLNVYVNAAGNPVSVAVGRGDTFYGPCDDVTELTGLKYTARCVIPLEALPSGEPARLTFFVARSNTEEVFSLEVLPIFADG